MTILLPDELGVPAGAQRPRVSWVPPQVSSAGGEAVELARMAGLVLDPWQEWTLANSLGERPDGKWAAFEVAVVAPRQNGKDAILEARELAGLFLLGERLVVHSAHQFDTSLEHFQRLLELIEGCSDFSRRVRRVSRSHGEEGIQLIGGQRIRFRTRTKGGGRGFSGDCLILNEAMVLSAASIGALLPTLSARPNPQVWYTGSAVDQEVHEYGITLARVRERGLKGGDPGLMYVEFSADGDHPERVSADVAIDPRVWAQANPGMGIRISAEHIAREQRSMDARTFAVERLGVGDWPRTDLGGRVISPEAWEACLDAKSVPLDPVCFAFDVTPDRSASAVAVAGRRRDGRSHIEVVDAARGTGWVPSRVADLVQAHRASGVICDASGPAASLLPELGRLGVDVTVVNSKEHAQACGLFVDAVAQSTLRHLGSAELQLAVEGAVKRKLGDAWAWHRTPSTVDISPLVACTLGLWGLETLSPPRRAPRVIDLSEVLQKAGA